MNREEWAQVEAELRNPYGSGAKVRADGHVLTLSVQRSKGLRFAIAVYVDGVIKGEWMRPESDIGAKFYRPRITSVFTAKAFARMEKECGKRFTNDMRKRHPPTVYMFDPSYPSAVELRRRLAKTCTSIELISCGYVPQALEAGA